MKKNYLEPDWPAAKTVHAVTTARHGGVSQAPYASFNLADHVGDSPASVRHNRALLDQQLELPSSPHWLDQVHGSVVVEAGLSAGSVSADAAYATKTGIVCAVLTADCLPVLFCDVAGQCVAAAHAGWRGLATGVLEATVSAMPVAPTRLLAWMGPAIGAGAFEVGEEVRQVFLRHNTQADACFVPVSEGKWRADIYGLAQLRLQAMGVRQIFGGGFCTFEDDQRFFSYRREGVTGRMASLIWLTE